MNKRINTLLVLLMLAAMQMWAGDELTLKDIVGGKFRAERMTDMEPAPDGESYFQVSRDGQRIEQFSFKTGKQTGTVLDLKTARGPRIDAIEGFILSPDGKRLLIQTETESIYRHSFTAKYYIFDIRNQKYDALSEGGPQRAPLFSPDGQQIAFVRDNNIFLVKLLYNNAESQLTKDGKAGEIINGVPQTRIAWTTAGCFLVCLAVTYLLGSSEPLMTNGTLFASKFWLKAVDMFIYTSIILIIGCLVGVIVSRFRS